MCLLGRHRYGPPAHKGDQVRWTRERCGGEKWSKSNYTPLDAPPSPKLPPIGGMGPG